MGGACSNSKFQKFCDFFFVSDFFFLRRRCLWACICVGHAVSSSAHSGIESVRVGDVLCFFPFFFFCRASVRRCVWMGDAVSSSAHSGIALVRVGDADVSSLDEHWQIC
jgi:hypothetical protein